MGMQVLVRFSDAPAEAGGPNQVWLCDGMFRRKVAKELASGDSITDGDIGNNGVHNGVMLDKLGNSGKTFVSGEGGWAGRDAWGVDLATLGGAGGLVPHTHPVSTSASISTSTGAATPTS